MFFRRKKKKLAELDSRFGQVKTEGFVFEYIKRYHSRKDGSDIFQTLSDQTCNDLDFDLFFCFADRTSSKIGQQYLYDQLRTIDYSQHKADRQEKVLEFLKENPKERLQLQFELSKLNTRDSYYVSDLFQDKVEEKSWWYFLFPIVSIAALGSLGISFVYPSFILIFLAIVCCNVLIHYSLKRKTNLFLNSIPALLALGAVAKSFSKKPFLREESSTIENSIGVIASIRRKMSVFRLDQKVDSDMEAAYWFLIESIKIIFLLEPLLLLRSMGQLQDKAKDIEQVFRFIGKIDTYVSIASLREGTDQYCIPKIGDTDAVKFKEMVHPLVQKCVPNDLETSKSILLTGANMSGKTTFLRSIGLNFISGMVLNTCFAETAHLPLAKLYSVIRIEDDLMSSSSYFFKEVDEIQKIIEDTSANSLILMDEMFKGTNTVERIAAAKAVLLYLEKRNGQVIVATHDIELATDVQQQFGLFHFTESIDDSTIDFDYKLKEGTVSIGNAIKILEMKGFPKEVIEDAKNAIKSKG